MSFPVRRFDRKLFLLAQRQSLGVFSQGTFSLLDTNLCRGVHTPATGGLGAGQDRRAEVVAVSYCFYFQPLCFILAFTLLSPNTEFSWLNFLGRYISNLLMGVVWGGRAVGGHCLDVQRWEEFFGAWPGIFKVISMITSSCFTLAYGGMGASNALVGIFFFFFWQYSLLSSLCCFFWLLFFNWDKVALHCCASFCYTMECISYRYTYIPSLLDLHPTTHPSHLGHHRTRKQAPCARLSRFPPGVFSTHTSVYVSSPVSQFILLSHPCPVINPLPALYLPIPWNISSVDTFFPIQFSPVSL